jgi:hypothetical protein
MMSGEGGRAVAAAPAVAQPQAAVQVRVMVVVTIRRAAAGQRQVGGLGLIVGRCLRGWRPELKVVR